LWSYPRAAGKPKESPDVLPLAFLLQRRKGTTAVLRQLIWHLCNSRPHGFLRTELVKFVYLCDVEFYRKHCRTITGLSYRYADYGPFSWDILDEATALVDQGLLSYTTVPASHRRGYGQVFRTRSDGGGDVELCVLDDLALSAVANVLERFSAVPLDELLDYVYTNPPACLFEEGDVIDFGEWIPNTDLDEVTKSEVDRRMDELVQSARGRLRSECSEYDVDTKREEDDHLAVVHSLVPYIADLAQRSEGTPQSSTQKMETG